MDEFRLRKYFKFEASDLYANRNGRVSEEQKKRIEAEVRAERKSTRESADILLVIALLGLGAGLLIVVNSPMLSAKVVIGLLLCVLWPFAWGSRAWKILKSAPPAGEDLVRAVTGQVHIARYEDDFVLEVGKYQFDLEKNPSAVIESGQELTIYFLERTEEILSIEEK